MSGGFLALVVEHFNELPQGKGKANCGKGDEWIGGDGFVGPSYFSEFIA